ncbi:hypothetical protein F5144DRAFT_626583 [Chaetomium tenue]|uniref:Uncharacterized protein n=1 Tax=Chaetomium tenue TaxID=1854479 RepID=A0ACB7PF25_9PEZI|nr:hypothetical protein F5144DRAFT_626583 [Chaetomium globosum]
MRPAPSASLSKSSVESPSLPPDSLPAPRTGPPSGSVRKEPLTLTITNTYSTTGREAFIPSEDIAASSHQGGAEESPISPDYEADVDEAPRRRTTPPLDALFAAVAIPGAQPAPRPRAEPQLPSASDRRESAPGGTLSSPELEMSPQENMPSALGVILAAMESDEADAAREGEVAAEGEGSAEP